MLANRLCLGTERLVDLGWVDLLAVLVVSHTWWGSAVAAALAGADTVLQSAMFKLKPLLYCIPNDLAVDGARNAVLQLEVHLGHGVLAEDRGIRDITCLTVSEVGRNWQALLSYG